MRGVALFGGLCVATLLLFLLAPQLDLWASGLFYDAGRGGFYLADAPPVALLYRAIPWITRGAVLLIAGATLWLVLMRRPIWGLDRKALIFLAVSLAIVPGLIVNTVLKDEWGRARPSQIEAFGGTRHFTPAPLPAGECSRNCSFVSGHAALAFGLVGFAFLLAPGRRRSGAIAAALAFGALAGLARIVQGGHFLSDVVYAGLIVFGCTWLLHRWIYVEGGLETPRAIRLYGWAGGRGRLGWSLTRQAYLFPAGRIGMWAALLTIAICLSVPFLDRPIAHFFQSRSEDLHSLFRGVSRFGTADIYLVPLAILFVVLRWGGALPGLAALGAAMRRIAPVPGFLFMAVAASGLVTDLVKIGLGRTRPKLLFSAQSFDFTLWGWQSDYWSFPSGHTTTIAALMTALWCLWPRHLLFYASIVVLMAVSRVGVGAHYPSDTLAASFIGVLVTRYVALVFARSGVDLAAAARGGIAAAPGPPLSWRGRLGLPAWLLSRRRGDAADLSADRPGSR